MAVLLLKYKDKQGAETTFPKYSLLNILLSKDLKGVSNLHRGIHESTKSVIADLSEN